MRTHEAIAWVVAIIAVMGLGLSSFIGRDSTARTEFLQQRERAALAFCLENGGVASFTFTPGADHLTFVGCAFGRSPQQAEEMGAKVPGAKTS